MNCQAIDVKAYLFGEGTAAERRDAQGHMKSCEECRNELAQLELVQAALGSLREEEPPRRIAFVSDKVFEPNWWQRFWASGAQVGFAASALLAAAILVHGVVGRPATVVNNPAPPVIARVNEAEQQQRIDAAVANAVARIEQRQRSEVQQLLTAVQEKNKLDRKNLELVAEENALLKARYQAVVQTAMVKY